MSVWYRRLSRASLSIALVLVVGVAWWKQQALKDWWRLRNYTPPTAVVQLATDTSMTAYAQHIFYLNHPLLEDKVHFNQDCLNKNEQTIVLGCYQSNQTGIYLYTISDTRLSGVEQVTAAHEMLHAAYDRLNINDRNYVDGLLMDYYQHDLRDQRIKDTIASYRQTEPNDVVNEMHSVFGTEVAQLPSPLENYYQRYFASRSKVTAYAASYQAIFVSIKNKVAQDDSQLTYLKSQIDTNEAGLKTQLNQLQLTKAQLDGYLNSHNVPAYNNAVPGYNTLVNRYNAEISATKQLIDQYNQLVTERNAAAVQGQQLQQALDSRLPSTH